MIEMPANPTASALIMASNENRKVLEQIRDALIAREAPAPGIFPMMSNGAVTPLRVNVRIRVQSLVVSSTAALVIFLRAGTKRIITFPIAANSVQSFDLPIVLDRGVTVEIIDNTTGITPVGVLDALIIGHVDYSETDADRHSAMHERLDR